jgi:hypothetical protein
MSMTISIYKHEVRTMSDFDKIVGTIVLIFVIAMIVISGYKQ